MLKRLLLSSIPLIVVIALPLFFRKNSEKIDLSADQLVILSSHSEAIRYEFEQGFRAYYEKITGRKVSIDWRSTGVASVSMFISSAYEAVFHDYWVNELKLPWNTQVAISFMNHKLKPDNPNYATREKFLKSNLSIGIDLLFGGGQYDLSKQAQTGTLIEIGVANPNSIFYKGDPNGELYEKLTNEARERIYAQPNAGEHPALYNELFGGATPNLVQSMGGETWYDKNDKYYGICFSSFGICMNLDRLSNLGYDISSGYPLRTWRDLAAPRLFKQIGLADPSKSGSINKCFEMIIQRQMQDTYKRLATDVAAGKMTETEALNQSWLEALTLVKQVGGNALYLTLYASKVPMDTASGQIAAGMCIDFYGRSQAEWEENHVGRKTMTYYTPDAASTVGADPIGMFRGAPHPECARLFIRYLLTKEGQLLWNQRAGTKGGPLKYTLHRLPVRRDCYTPEHRALMSAPDADPFGLASSFTYKAAWTAQYYDLIRILIRVMVLDCRDELQSSWKAILDAGGPQAVPQAYNTFCRLPFNFSDASEMAKMLLGTESQIETTRQWIFFFRDEYNQAIKLAKEGK
jgi:ABC-type Fe3+ transport system substrate-binding protein